MAGREQRVAGIGACQQPPCSSHHLPVVFVGNSADQANLIVATIGVDARPGESVRATACEELLQEIHCLTACFGLFQGSYAQRMIA